MHLKKNIHSSWLPMSKLDTESYFLVLPPFLGSKLKLKVHLEFQDIRLSRVGNLTKINLTKIKLLLLCLIKKGFLSPVSTTGTQSTHRISVYWMNGWMNERIHPCPMCSLHSTFLLGWLIGKIMNAFWRLVDLSSKPLSTEFMSQSSCLTFQSLNFLICEMTVPTTSTAY